MKRVCNWFLICDSPNCRYKTPSRTNAKLLYCNNSRNAVQFLHLAGPALMKEEYKQYFKEHDETYGDLVELVDVDDD